jgi:hypothetical protein
MVVARVYAAALAAMATAAATAAISISSMICHGFIAYQACASGPMVEVSVVKIFASSIILVTASCKDSFKALIICGIGFDLSGFGLSGFGLCPLEL